MSACYCGLGKQYAACCGRLHSGAENALAAETLMRSRYSAYVLRLADYLLATWHPDTRPSELDLTADDTKWLGLEVKKHALQDDCHATVNSSPATASPARATACTNSAALSARKGAGITLMVT